MLMSHAVFFVAGGLVARKIVMEHFFDEAEKADAHVLLGHYTGYRDIAVAINEGKYTDAKCLTELNASAMFDSLRTCTSDVACGDAIGQKARSSAPEIFGKAPMGFSYIESKEGIKSCRNLVESENPTGNLTSQARNKK